MSKEQGYNTISEVNRMLKTIKDLKKLAEKPESYDITKDGMGFMLRDKGGVKNLQKKEYDDIFDALDLRKEGNVESTLFVGLVIAVVVEGDIEPKFSELFKVKDGGRGSMNETQAQNFIDYYAKVLAFINEVEYNLLYYLELNELKEKVRKKFKTQKVLNCRDLFLIACANPLIDLMSEQQRKLNFDEIPDIEQTISEGSFRNDRSSIFENSYQIPTAIPTDEEDDSPKKRTLTIMVDPAAKQAAAEERARQDTFLNDKMAPIQEEPEAQIENPIQTTIDVTAKKGTAEVKSQEKGDTCKMCSIF
jgi:hypothetical protein